MPVAEISLANLRPNPKLASAVSAKLRATNLGQMVLMQEQLFEDAMNLEIPAKDRAACVRAYEVLEKRKRMNRGLADPAPLKPSDRPAKRQSAGLTRPRPIYKSSVANPASG